MAERADEEVSPPAARAAAGDENLDGLVQVCAEGAMASRAKSTTSASRSTFVNIGSVRS